MSKFLQQVRRSVLAHTTAALTDGQLLTRFLDRRDNDALAALVRRHGPMVWGVCRRRLPNPQDAEDAFQATFLVLVRKAASVRPRELVANWLYGVACTTAHRARVANAKRRAKERQVPDMPEPAAAGPDPWHDLRPLLDEELRRLPDKYRVLIILCDLEGKTRIEAARQLGCPEGTVAGRLARARALLARRLARRGLGVSGGALAAALAQHAVSAGVPPALLACTIDIAGQSAAGQAASGLISAQVVALTEGVLQTMYVQQIKGMTALLVAAVFLAGGLFTYHTALGESEDAGQERKEAAGPAPAKTVPAQGERPFQIEEINARMLRDLGNRFDVEVVGRTKGTVSGTELYFYDSELDVAAVHAGLVKPGEKAVITVTVVKCPPSGAGSTQHGVRSLPWDAARAGDTALLLQRRPGKAGQKPRPADPNRAGGSEERGAMPKPKGLTLDEAARTKVNQTATVEFCVASATMAWTTGFGNPDPWVIDLTPTAGLKGGGTFQLCLSGKVVTHLRNLGLVNEHGRKPSDFFRDKVIRLTGKVESWEDRGKRGVTLYRLCVFDLDHLEVVNAGTSDRPPNR
jgi:RNA polymerase sigma factor (sigma-70 family)